MSEGRSGKSHAFAWALSILAVPTIYVLSFPPLTWFVIHDHLDKVGAESVNAYAKPYWWLSDKLRWNALVKYRSWWWRFLGEP